jgi:hypothetical protein
MLLIIMKRDLIRVLIQRTWTRDVLVTAEVQCGMITITVPYLVVAKGKKRSITYLSGSRKVVITNSAYCMSPLLPMP